MVTSLTTQPTPLASDLIPMPILDIRTEDKLAADAIARTSGSITREMIAVYIATLQELDARLLAGSIAAPPVCPELINANPSSPHTAILMTFAWVIGQVTYLMNQLPDAVRIEFARLFGAAQLPATMATTTLTFTSAAPDGVETVIPAGTRVATSDAGVTFETDEELIIIDGEFVGSVAAHNTVTGAIVLAPATLTKVVDPPAYVTGVSNLAAIDSGSDLETIENALSRAREYQIRSQRLVTAADLESAILNDILHGAGVVKAFPFVKQGAWTTAEPGYTTVVVMTRSGLPVSDEVKYQINALLPEMIGSTFVYIIDPVYKVFNVIASMRLTGIITQSAVKAEVERRLRAYYSAQADNFGRRVSRSEVISIIENTPGVEVLVPVGDEIISEPAEDQLVAAYELPYLDTVTLTVVP